MEQYDFAGWATKNDLKCADGRTIRKDAFKNCDGKKVPLVWNHNHSDPECVLGHAFLQNCDEGVRCYGKFNNNSLAHTAKECLRNGDIDALSIWANSLIQTKARDVLHGDIKEVSLVLAGANPGALIDDIVVHGNDGDEEAFIYSGEGIELMHADDNKKEEESEMAEIMNKPNDDPKSETVADVIDSMSDKQKTVMYGLIGKIIEKYGIDEENDMKHNVFDSVNNDEETLQHSAEITDAIADFKRYGSMRDSFIAHGIENVDWLFPEDRVLDTPPRIIDNDMSWVSTVMSGVTHVPYSRVKSMFADMTEEDARAKGYIKGNYKKEQVFGLLKRSTAPTTIYKKQRMDRDDIVDITTIDVVAFIKKEMRVKLDEELARAILIGDGRPSSSDDKINEQNIRPILTDDDLFTIKCPVDVRSADAADVRAKAAIKAMIKARKNYKGSGSPTFYCSEDILTEMLLLEDGIGHPLYADEAALARKLRVKNIVTVPHMDGANGPNNGDLVGIIVNLKDYMVGADKGGSVNMFDDFNLDYNQMIYLIETRCSGALVVPYSAIAVEYNVTA